MGFEQRHGDGEATNIVGFGAGNNGQVPGLVGGHNAVVVGHVEIGRHGAVGGGQSFAQQPG